MKKENTATFIGHRQCFELTNEKIDLAVRELINRGYTTFLNGGMGTFDWMAARTVYELKEEFHEIQNFLVIPYLTFTVAEKIYFDDILYQEDFEQYYFRKAILKRNQFLIEHSSAAVCFVRFSFGGAIKTYRNARRHGLALVEL